MDLPSVHTVQRILVLGIVRPVSAAGKESSRVGRIFTYIPFDPRRAASREHDEFALLAASSCLFRTMATALLLLVL